MNASPGGPAANIDQIEFWNGRAGETWAALQERLDRQIQPLGRLAMDRLAPKSGERVLDIGCGCGQTTMELAQRVGPSGLVVGIDVSEPMLAVARQRRAGAAAGPVSFLRADAQTHAFEAQSVDAAFSRFGVMFFADPVAAFRNIRVALKAGGRIAFVCWQAVGLNPFMTTPLIAALPFLDNPPAPPDPEAPGPFAFADVERVRRILSAAGYADIQIEAHEEAIGGGDVEETAKMALAIGPLGAAIREQPAARVQVEAAVRAALADHVRDGRVFLQSASWIVTARNGQTG